MPRDIPMPHPGTILREEFLSPMGLSTSSLAEAIHVPTSRIDAICSGGQSITADIALRLGHHFGVDPQWFLAMQAMFDRHLQDEASLDGR